jgi:hypothetical protein
MEQPVTGLLKDISLVKTSKDISILLQLIGLALIFSILGPKWSIITHPAWICIVTLIPMVIIHEGLHGLFFWFWSKKVKFGHMFSSLGPSFYAAALGKKFSRNRFIVIALIPQILTVICLGLALSLPLIPWVEAFLLCTAAFNLGGGVGDFYVVFNLFRFPKTVMVEDYIGGVKIYSGEISAVLP